MRRKKEPEGSQPENARRGIFGAVRGALRGAAMLAIVGGACDPPLRPGMGGLRVQLNGARAGQRSTVSVRVDYQASSRPAIQLATTTQEALLVDLAPNSYEVVAYADDGRGGFYRTWAGNGRARVEAGRVTRIDLDLASGLAVTGRVLDAATRQPLDHVNVLPPPHLASARWPSNMPGLWAETRADGTFAIGGIEPYIPVPPGASAGPRERAWLRFSRDGYVEQSVVLEGPDSQGPRVLEVVLQRTGAG